MDGNWFRKALADAGITQADLARELRLAPSAVSRMIKGERQMRLQEAVEISGLLGVAEQELLGRAAGEAAPSTNVPRRRGRPSRAEPQRQPRLDVIPIRQGPDGEVTGETLRPGNLAGVRGAYATYVTGDELSPRYEPGWLLHVHPFKPPTKGRDVVVRKTDHTVLIKQFVGWAENDLVLRQLHPVTTIRVPRDQVAECHLVVGVDQEG